jgi:uncharacterized protein YqgC (DUF456 family)
MECKTKSQKFNRAVGEVVGTVLQFFGCLYLILALLTGLSVLTMGMQRVFSDWHHTYGTFELVFWIVTATIGILFFVVDYARALWRGLQEWVGGTKRAKTTNQPDGG